jgi:hypothetical protein|tara:strand:+ start:430 stop:603 length:174 start_codon:yes stop_codon:yes gene_type:complete
MQPILDNWETVLLALLVFARVVASLYPTDTPALKIFGWIDSFITLLVGGDKRKNKNN